MYCTAMYHSLLFVALVAPIAPILALDKPPQMESKLDKQMLLSTGKQSAFVLNCLAKADPPPTYQWFRGDHKMVQGNGVEVEGGKLLFSNPGLHHEGYYHCLASNKFGVAKSTVVHLTPTFTPLPAQFVPPSFVRAPENEIKPIGGTAKFECRGEGKPEPEVTWYKNGRSMAGNNKDKLIIKNIDQADVANYACNISNIAGYEYKDVYLNILRQSAKIKTGPREEETVSKGSNVTIHCVAEGFPKPVISWQFNGVQISGGGKYSVDQNTGDLVIRKVGTEDEGKYRCTATNQDDKDSKEGNIIVKSVTTIVDGPRDSEHEVRSNIIMNCTVMYDLSQDLTVTWKKDNQDLQELGGRIKVEDNHSLTINNVTFSDAGDYTCWARTSTSEDTDNGKLVVRIIPPKLKFVEPVETMEDDDIVLECVVEEGFPLPEVAWYKDGDADGELEDDHKFRIKEDNSLVIKNSGKEDSGVYICEAINNNDKVEEGEDSIVVDVTVRRKTEISGEATSHLFSEEQVVMLDCLVTVDPDLKRHLMVTWFHGEEELKDLPVQHLNFNVNSEVEDMGVEHEGSVVEEEVERRFVMPNNTLVINDLTEDDLGEYRCEARVDKKGLEERLVVGPISEIYTFVPFPWWIIVVVIIVLLLLIIIVCVVCKAKKRRSGKGYYDVNDIEKTGKKHNKSDIYYVPADVDGDSIMNESDNFLLNDKIENKTPIFTPKTIRHLNKVESNTGSLGSLFEEDDFIMKGMDEDGSFRERYAE